MYLIPSFWKLPFLHILSRYLVWGGAARFDGWILKNYLFLVYGSKGKTRDLPGRAFDGDFSLFDSKESMYLNMQYVDLIYISSFHFLMCEMFSSNVWDHQCYWKEARQLSLLRSDAHFSNSFFNCGSGFMLRFSRIALVRKRLELDSKTDSIINGLILEILLEDGFFRWL